MSIQVPPDSTGKVVDTTSLTDGVVTVERQRVILSGGSGTAEVVVVTDAVPAGTEMGIVTRQAGTATIAGNINISAMPKVALSGTSIVAGAIDISSMPRVTLSGTATIEGRVVISSTATIAGSVVISGTATVAGVVGLTAGTAVIGDLNAISRTVQVAIGTPFTVNDISRTVQVAIATPFTVQAISTTVTTAVTRVYASPAVPSASRGPRCIIASTSANVTLVAGPGAGFAIYVTGLQVSNASGTNTRARVGTSASIGQVQMMMAASGGGFVATYDPPWKLSTTEALLGSVKPNASEGIFNIHFFVASADAL